MYFQAKSFAKIILINMYMPIVTSILDLSWLANCFINEADIKFRQIPKVLSFGSVSLLFRTKSPFQIIGIHG